MQIHIWTIAIDKSMYNLYHRSATSYSALYEFTNERTNSFPLKSHGTVVAPAHMLATFSSHIIYTNFVIPHARTTHNTRYEHSTTYAEKRNRVRAPTQIAVASSSSSLLFGASVCVLLTANIIPRPAATSSAADARGRVRVACRPRTRSMPNA